MTDRLQLELCLREFYAARVAGDFEKLCPSFTNDAIFRIEGVSRKMPISVVAVGTDELRPWLGLLIKSFRVENFVTNSFLIDGSRAAVHWRANIRSRITGTMAATEFLDLVEYRDRAICSYLEWLTCP